MFFLKNKAGAESSAAAYIGSKEKEALWAIAQTPPFAFWRASITSLSPD